MNPAPGANKVERMGLEKETVMELEVLSKHTTASTWCASGLMPFSRVTRPRNTKCPSGRCSSWGMLQPTDAFNSTGLGRFELITALGTRKLTRRMIQDRPKSGRRRRILSMRWLPSRSIAGRSHYIHFRLS